MNTELENSSVLLSELRANLELGAVVMMEAVSKLDPKTSSLTHRAYVVLCQMMQQGVGAVDKLAGVAGIALLPSYVPNMDLFQLTERLDKMEQSVIDAMKPFNLDALPEGNPGEASFEAELKKLIGLNRVNADLLHGLSTLHNALSSETFKIGLNEEQRDASWKSARRRNLLKVLENTRQSIAEIETHLGGLKKCEADVCKQIELNDTVEFDFSAEAAQEAKPEDPQQEG